MTTSAAIAAESHEDVTMDDQGIAVQWTLASARWPECERDDGPDA